MPLFMVLGLSLGVLAAGCARPRAEPRRLPAWVFQAARPRPPTPVRRTAGVARPVTVPRPRGGIRGQSAASDFVVAALQGGGLRFGTDGSVPALWGYLRTSHLPIPAPASRPGDILFFHTGSAPPPSGQQKEFSDRCDWPDHVGIVAAVDGDGRIAFVEARDGQVRRSYVDPRRPQRRRDDKGRVLNSFLRPKRMEDPHDGPVFAGEMVCGAARPRL